MISRLLPFVPFDVHSRVYREPFLGAGSLFFALQPPKAVLSDVNEPLIRCYEFVRDCWGLVASYLLRHARANTKDHFYSVRETYNHSAFSAAQAARFIYLNKTCFNGVFRVNKRNEFNVPYGWKEPPTLPGRDVLEKASDALQKVQLLAASYQEALASASQGDFVYLDPPYPPLNGTSYFTHYTKDRFRKKDQENLAEVVRELARRGCLIMMSNADVSLVKKLYKGFQMFPLCATRFVTCKARRHVVREVVITNYELPRAFAPAEGVRV